MTGSKGASPIRPDTERGATAQFIKKTAIVAAAAVLSLMVAVEWTLASLDEFVSRSTELAIGRIEEAIRSNTQTIVADLRGATSGSRVVARLERGLEWMADPATEPSPERREKLLAAVRVVTERWRPVIVEALAIMAGTEDTGAVKR